VTGLRYLLTGLVVAVVAGMPAASAMDLVSTIPLPGVKGRIDHLSADPRTHRIFVAALGNDTVEMLDTRSDRRRTIAGLGEPQGVLYLPDSDRLFIANGGSNRVDVVDVASLSVVRRVEGMNDADNVRYDATARKVWVGYGKGALRMLEPPSGESAGEIPLPGHPESFQLEQGGSRAFVNVPTARSVVVVDRTKRQVIDRWETPGVSSNYPMALDETGERLFVGARTPPTLLVYDTASGKVVARLPIGKDTDDVFFDAERKRIYVICGEGKVNVFRQDTPDRYVIEESLDTAPRARTGLFVPEEAMLYVAAPASGASPARILGYRVR
jgi:DNA-binding beta-propeller fold protein YncE